MYTAIINNNFWYLSKPPLSSHSLIHYTVFIFGTSMNSHAPNKRLKTMGSRLKKSGIQIQDLWPSTKTFYISCSRITFISNVDRIIRTHMRITFIVLIRIYNFGNTVMLGKHLTIVCKTLPPVCSALYIPHLLRLNGILKVLNV